MAHMSEGKSSKSPIKEKVDTLNRFLNDEHMLIHLCPRSKGVSIPDYLMDNPTVTLKLSRHFRGKLEITEERVKTELLFNDKYFDCVVPFEALWGMTSFRGQFLMWPESTPQEVFDTLIKQAKDQEGDSGAQSDTDELSELDDVPKKEIRKGHLRRIK
jgi:stringent starvation protein B